MCAYPIHMLVSEGCSYCDILCSTKIGFSPVDRYPRDHLHVLHILSSIRKKNNLKTSSIVLEMHELETGQLCPEAREKNRTK